MSRSVYTATFPDGTVRYGISNDTVGVLWPALFDTKEQAWEGWRFYRAGDWQEHNRIYYPAPVGDPEPVTLTDDLTGRYLGQGQATPNCLHRSTAGRLVSAVDDHRNGDCYGDDRCPVCAHEDAERLDMLRGLPAGAIVQEKDGDRWQATDSEWWVLIHPAPEDDTAPDTDTIEHIDRAWGPVEVIDAGTRAEPVVSDLDAVVRLARAATAHNTGETVWEASTHGDRHVLRMSSVPRAEEAITGLAVAGWDARLMPEDGGHPRIEVRRAP